MTATSVTSAPAIKVQNTEVYSLWVDDEWYIPVAADGCCVGQCGEGALGFIVQLLSTSLKGGIMALKIPRMVAETHRENAYISELLLQERNSVQKIFTSDEGEKGIDIAGLLPAQSTFNPLRRPLTIRELRNEARAWHGALIFVHYEKGHNPYFCLVKPDSTETYPPQAKAPKLSQAQFDAIREKSVGQAPGAMARDWTQVVFVTQPNEPEQENSGAGQPSGVVTFNVTEALSPAKSSTAITWYTCVPSVAYTWAPHTLQETIGLVSRGATWSLPFHLQLIENICNGIKVLHTKGMLHADIRPANIVHLGDPKDPEKYYLSDYGSFATTNIFPVQRQGVEPSGQSIIGPVVEGERTSAFYAPERQTGRERETADTTIVIPLASGETYYILVGWKSEFKELNLLDSRSQPNISADEYIDFIQKRREEQTNKKTSTTSLDEGDRIQLRDYVFELIAREEILENMQLFECHKVFWTVYHSKIVINENKPFNDCFAFPIPRIIELPQWSAATDIYSLGVLALYSVYSDASNQSNRRLGKQIATESEAPLATITPLNESDSRAEDSDDLTLPPATPVTSSLHNTADKGPISRSQEKEQNWSAVDKLDEGFEAMLTLLADKSLFNAVWPKLEWLRHQIEKKLAETGKWTAESLATADFEPNPKLQDASLGNAAAHEPAENANASSSAGQRNLRTEAEAVSSQITSTVPGIERLLHLLLEQREAKTEGAASDTSGANPQPDQVYQLGPFIFFIHFVLRCLHRQDSMDADKQKWKDEEWQGEKWMTVPFCQDRHETPSAGTINEALARLKQVRAIIDSGALKGLWTGNIAKYDLRPENEIRQELTALQADKRRWDNLMLQTNTQIDTLKVTKQQLEGELENQRQKQQAIDKASAAAITSINKGIERLQQANWYELARNRQAVVDEISQYLLDAFSAYPQKE